MVFCSAPGAPSKQALFQSHEAQSLVGWAASEVAGEGSRRLASGGEVSSADRVSSSSSVSAAAFLNNSKSTSVADLCSFLSSVCFL